MDEVLEGKFIFLPLLSDLPSPQIEEWLDIKLGKID